MKKTLFLTGSTDGIGFAAAKLFAEQGHTLFLHGRNAKKLEQLVEEIHQNHPGTQVESWVADFSDLTAVQKMAKHFQQKHSHLDVLINNAGVFHTPITHSPAGYACALL